LDRKLARHLSLEDAIDITCGKPKYIALLIAIGQQAAFFSEETLGIDGRKIVASSLQDDSSAMNVWEAIRYHDQSAIWLACQRRDDAIEFGRIANKCGDRLYPEGSRQPDQRQDRGLSR
jgi:hypothetical protein